MDSLGATLFIVPHENRFFRYNNEGDLIIASDAQRV